MNGGSSPSPREERAGRRAGVRGNPMLTRIASVSKRILLTPALSSLGGRRGRKFDAFPKFIGFIPRHFGALILLTSAATGIVGKAHHILFYSSVLYAFLLSA